MLLLLFQTKTHTHTKKNSKKKLKKIEKQKKANDDVTLLGVMIDKNLTFKKHVGNLVRQVHYKLHALRRIRKFLTIEKAKIQGNAFIDSQFNYAPLIWMYCRKTLYSKIQKIHHRILKVVYGIDDSYKNLLLRSNSVSIHQRHLRFLVTEIFKSISQINPEFICGRSLSQKILQFEKRTNSKFTKNSVDLLRYKCYSL